MNLKQINDYLIKEGYLITIRGKPLLSNKYFRDILKENNFNLPVVQTTQQLVKKVDTLDYTEMFKQFIDDADIPFRISTKDGGQYTVRTTSKGVINEFKRIMEKGISYQTLVACTKLYYKNEKLYRQTLMRYLKEGTWEYEYQQLINKLGEGAEQLQKHINKELGNGSNAKTI